jgi:hypothetical protein
MSEMISQIIEKNRTISSESVIDQLALFLNAAPNHGISFIELTFKNPKKSLDVYFSSFYLSLLSNYSSEKNNLAREIIKYHEDFVPDLERIIGQLDKDNLNLIIEKSKLSANSTNFESAIYEIAVFHPDLLRDSQIRLDKGAQQGLLPGSSIEIVNGLAKKYEEGKALSFLNDLAMIRTDEALEKMFDILDNAPTKHKDTIEILIENMGVFPAEDDRRASFFFQNNYHGFIMARADSPHHMGAGFSGDVPCCSKTGISADRILTLKRSNLDLDLGDRGDPSFFWFNGAVPQEGIFVQCLPEGIRCLNTPQAQTEGTNIIPGALSMVLEAFPLTYGSGIPALVGRNSHQIGGYVPTIRFEHFPICPICGRRMRLLASIDSGATAYGRIQTNGILHGYWCKEDSVTCTKMQTY